MPIEMPRGLPFSVDTWSRSSMRKRYHFLTHAHSDHLAALTAHAAFPIYASRLTRSLVLRRFPQLQNDLFLGIEPGETVLVNDPDGDFAVTAFDANHCPGAIMFLFEGEFGNILHTGDCRLTPNCLQYLPLKYLSKKGREAVCHLDYLFLDCTFGRCSLNFPSKESAIQQVINCIWKHPNAPTVYLACDLLGQEEILVAVSKTFRSKIFVDKTNSPECYHALLVAAPEILSEDASSQFQAVEGFPRLSERASEKLADARAKHQPEPLFIRPSTQWYAGIDNTATQRQKPKLTEAERDDFGVWHVCYSIHSSQEELDWALKLLQPKWVISTTPPCRAMELDYVKKHCFKTQITPDDPLWKLLKVRTGKSASLLPPPTIVSKNDGTSASLPLQENTKCASLVGVTGKSASLPSPPAIVSKNDSLSASLPLQENTKCASLVGVSTYAECNLLKSNSLCTNHLAECNQLESNSIRTNHLLKLDLSSPSTAQPITLFGRARLGLIDHDVLQHEKSVFSISDKEAESLPSQKEIAAGEPSPLQNSSFLDKFPPTVHELSLQDNAVAEAASFLLMDNNAKQVAHKQEEVDGVKRNGLGMESLIIDKFPPTVHELSLQDNAVAEPASFLLMDNNAKQVAHKQEEVDGVKRNGLGMESLVCSSIVESGAPKLEDANSRKDTTYLGSSRSYNTSLRRLYRSMNVPVPRPLPSLVQLMDSSKRIKMSSESSYSGLNYCSKYYL